MRSLLAVCGSLCLAATLQAQSAIQPATQKMPLPAAPADPAIAQALTRISAQQIHNDIAKLVTYGNRSTLEQHG